MIYCNNFSEVFLPLLVHCKSQQKQNVLSNIKATLWSFGLQLASSLPKNIPKPCEHTKSPVGTDKLANMLTDVFWP